jgi:hypothetical protein
MPIPLLPLDVIYVVACHLAGSYAFGTLASLHLTNHDVAETVLPVLYEAVLVDNENNVPIGGEAKGGYPNRFTFTR